MSFYNTATLPNSVVLPLGKPVAEWANVQHLPLTADISASVLANNLTVQQMTVNTLLFSGPTGTIVNLPSNNDMWSMLGASTASPISASNIGNNDVITWKLINIGNGPITFRAPNASQKVVAARTEATLTIKWTVVGLTRSYTIIF